MNGHDLTTFQNDHRARLIAFYLPQYHPTPENDEWWGNDFTEWTNVAKAKPLFPGHYQPRLPADLGFYDLRVPETRAAQAELARDYGIEAFCYYHYWFAGRQLLERPFAEVLSSGEPKFPFCLCWANETWKGIWHGADGRTLIEQTYPGPQDDEQHFYWLLNAFADDRYFKVDGMPLFAVYKPSALPDPRQTTDLWRELAHRSGLKGLYLVGVEGPMWLPAERELARRLGLSRLSRVGVEGSSWTPSDENGFDASVPRPMLKLPLSETRASAAFNRLIHKLLSYPRWVFAYEKAFPYMLYPETSNLDIHPCVVPNWDNTPRSGRNGMVLHRSIPELFRLHLRQNIEQVRSKSFEHRLVFIKSWNEWAEGNYLEPDLRFGRAYLEVVRDEICCGVGC